MIILSIILVFPTKATILCMYNTRSTIFFYGVELQISRREYLRELLDLILHLNAPPSLFLKLSSWASKVSSLVSMFVLSSWPSRDTCYFSLGHQSWNQWPFRWLGLQKWQRPELQKHLKNQTAHCIGFRYGFDPSCGVLIFIQNNWYYNLLILLLQSRD